MDVVLVKLTGWDKSKIKSRSCCRFQNAPAYFSTAKSSGHKNVLWNQDLDELEDFRVVKADVHTGKPDIRALSNSAGHLGHML